MKKFMKKLTTEFCKLNLVRLLFVFSSIGHLENHVWFLDRQFQGINHLHGTFTMGCKGARGGGGEGGGWGGESLSCPKLVIYLTEFSCTLRLSQFFLF